MALSPFTCSRAPRRRGPPRGRVLADFPGGCARGPGAERCNAVELARTLAVLERRVLAPIAACCRRRSCDIAPYSTTSRAAGPVIWHRDTLLSCRQRTGESLGACQIHYTAVDLTCPVLGRSF
jgi:hypothetical protein